MREYREYKKYCLNCEKPFKATRDDAQYCLTRCRVAAHRRRNKPTLAQALDQAERENLWYVRDLSSRAYRTLTTIYNTHGLEPARLAMLACLQCYENEQAVTSDVTHIGVL